MVEIPLLIVQVSKLTWMLNRIKSYGRKKYGAEENPRIAKIVLLRLNYLEEHGVDRRDNDIREFCLEFTSEAGRYDADFFFVG
jgi:hypothetical protein